MSVETILKTVKEVYLHLFKKLGAHLYSVLRLSYSNQIWLIVEGLFFSFYFWNREISSHCLDGKAKKGQICVIGPEQTHNTAHKTWSSMGCECDVCVIWTGNKFTGGPLT